MIISLLYYLRGTIRQEELSGLATLSIEKNLADHCIVIKLFINKFASDIDEKKAIFLVLHLVIFVA